MRYKHTQRSFLLLGAVAVVEIGVASRLPENAVIGPHLLFAVLLLVVCVLFSSLTVRIERDTLIWHFTFGFWKKSLPLSEIEKCTAVRNRWYYGWGIRKIPHGWLYTVYRLDAIELQRSGDHVTRIGTDEPGKLSRAIGAAIAAKT